MRKFNVTVNGNTYEVLVDEVSAEAVANVPSNQNSFKPSAPAPVAAPAVTAPVIAKAPAAAPATGGTPLKSPMPGMILKFKAEDGQQVKKGQVIVILEAMKMENDLVAPADGCVKFLLAQGANVSSGTVIAVIN